MTTAEISALIASCGALIALISLLVTARRNARTEAKTDSADMTTVVVKLENIATGVTEIKADMRNIRADVMDNRERLVAVEASTKQAHKRIDNWESKR